MTHVLFVCSRNGGKSPMAAGLFAAAARDTGVTVSSAGTSAGTSLNALSVESLREIDVDISAHTPTRLTPEMLAAADLVVVLGREARVDPASGPAVETWVTDEPAERGIEGIDRMRLIRDDIAERVAELADRLRA